MEKWEYLLLDSKKLESAEGGFFNQKKVTEKQVSQVVVSRHNVVFAGGAQNISTIKTLIHYNAS